MRERAEPDAFLAFRPWLLVFVVCAALVAGVGRRGLIFAAVALFILAATTGEWIVLTMTGAPDAAIVGRSVAASLVLGLAAFVMAAAFRRLFVHRWAAALATLMFAVGALALKPPMPSLMHAFERGIRPAPAAATSTPKPLSAPRAVLMTDLPLVWGEAVATGVLDGAASPPAAYRALTEVAAIVPVDAIGPATLDGADLLILAQPRALRPIELVRIDDWVRAGHRALVFVDPALAWARDLSPQVRRPPSTSLLGPLTRRWGADIAAVRPGFRMLNGRGEDSLFGAGRIAVRDSGVIEAGTDCRLSAEALVADCRIGKGRVLIVADADLLSDRLWVGPGPMGAGRAGRIADNDLFVRGAARALAGGPIDEQTARIESFRQVRWMTARRASALELVMAGLAPALILLGGAVAVALRIHRQ